MTTGKKCYEFINDDGTITARIIANDFYDAIRLVGDNTKANSDMDFISYYSAINDDDEVTGNE